jgi:hypothetical protein
MNIPAVAFKAKNKENRYLCDGPDCGDWSDEYLDTQERTDALYIIPEITTNKQLASDLLSWMEGLELVGVEQPPECDYCEETVDKVRPSPFLGDVGSMMCKGCWDMTKNEYAASHDEHIGEFEDYPHFK